MILWWTEYAIQAAGWTLVGMLIGVTATWAALAKKGDDQ